MLNVAIIGSGPAGYYTAEGLLKSFGGDVCIDIIDRLPTPFGLIRAGVAPDHQSIKAVSRRYETTSLSEHVRFVGNLSVGDGVTIEELLKLYHAVVIATGAPADRKLGVPGEDLPGVVGSAAFVGWYNGHPDFADLAPPLDAESVAVVGNGNVALDVARILAKTQEELSGSDIAAHAAAALKGSKIRDIHIIGRRGPHQVGFTPKELGEMGELQRAYPVVDAADFPPPVADASLDPGLRKVVGFLREFSGRAPREDAPVRVHFHFFAKPVAVEGDGKAEKLVLERTALTQDGQAVGTGETYDIPAGMVVPCIGYRTSPIPGVPYDAARGRFSNTEGRIAPGLYCVGWARRGPTGTIGTNRPDGFMIAEEISADAPSGDRDGPAGLDKLIAERDLYVVTFRDWQKIDAAEIARARTGAPREKFVRVGEMLEETKRSS
ncbi:FAD-dependent oxidoreductase [Sphingoaurantiacus capsulatus]|uniref:FAD-dependent oxidoreductase n=1 Tax=Sphingoaurantiacus capsulatus TaxID=1771310 RepID=A0ABV7XCA1_9SPHN